MVRVVFVAGTFFIYRPIFRETRTFVNAAKTTKKTGHVVSYLTTSPAQLLVAVFRILLHASARNLPAQNYPRHILSPESNSETWASSSSGVQKARYGKTHISTMFKNSIANSACLHFEQNLEISVLHISKFFENACARRSQTHFVRDHRGQSIVRCKSDAVDTFQSDNS